MSSALAWFCGRLVDERAVPLPASSSALTHAVSVYETLRVVGGRAPLVARHSARLARACAELGLEGATHDWDSIVRELCVARAQRDGRARITIGDGFVLVSLGALPADLEREREQGIALPTARVAHALPHFKHGSRLALWLAEREAGGEVALRGPADELLETTRASLLLVERGELWTAPVTQALPGIGRELALEAARELGLDVVERAPTLAQLAPHTELFTTNAVRGVRPVVRLDARELPAVATMSFTRRIQRALDVRMALA